MTEQEPPGQTKTVNLTWCWLCEQPSLSSCHALWRSQMQTWQCGWSWHEWRSSVTQRHQEHSDINITLTFTGFWQPRGWISTRQTFIQWK